MAKQINKTVIGGFVISAIAMLIIGVIILGGGEMFKKKVKYIMFFEQSVKGLSVGAPVMFRGVEIGSVSNVVIDYDQDKLKVNIPVIVEFDPSLVKMKGKAPRNKQELDQRMTQLIERGFRAQLVLKSMVTGQLMIETDFYSDTPARLTGVKSKYPEIPTIPSSMEQLSQKLKDMPIDKIAEKLFDLLDNIEKVTGDSAVQEIIRNLDDASKNLERLVFNANKMITDSDVQIKKVLDSLAVTSSDAQKILGDARTLVKNVDGQIQPVSDKVQNAMVSTKGAMDQAKTTLAAIDNFVGEDSDTRHKLNRALDQISAAAQSMDSLMDYLERHPEALLKGKSGGG
jgi:paraquat-inducible protein B